MGHLHLSAARWYWAFATTYRISLRAACLGIADIGPAWITRVLGRVDHEFMDISAMALNAAISGSILAEPEACMVIMMALPLARRGR